MTRVTRVTRVTRRDQGDQGNSGDQGEQSLEVYAPQEPRSLYCSTDGLDIALNLLDSRRANCWSRSAREAGYLLPRHRRIV